MTALDRRAVRGPTAEAAGGALAAKRSRASVLVVDAEPVSRRLLEDTLRRLKHPCTFAQDAQQAHDLYGGVRPDVVIVDPTMRDFDGLEFCRRIRESAYRRYCYVILLTACGEDDTILAGVRAGVDDALTRPLDPRWLETRLIAAHRVSELHAKLARSEAELVKATAGASGGARRDPLTGLGNRLGLSEDLAALDGRTRRYGRSYCIALCRLDSHGEDSVAGANVASDSVLSAVGRALRDECRGSDFVYRAGGDEFVVVLPDRTTERAHAVLERMRRSVEALATPVSGDDPLGIVAMSAGVASARGRSCREVLAAARAALQHADAHGRASIVVGTDSAPRVSGEVGAALAARAPRFTHADERHTGSRDRRTWTEPPRGSQPASAPPGSIRDARSVA